MNAVNNQARTIQFYYNGDVVAVFGQFGRIEIVDGDAGLYKLHVFRRHNFDEVVRYIRNWNRTV